MSITTEPAPLVERLKISAQQWAFANDASLARLGKQVMNDSGFFSRIDGNPVTTTATLERFARFLGDQANWPEGVVPSEVRAFVHITGVTAEAVEPSPGKTGDDSHGIQAADERAA